MALVYIGGGPLITYVTASQLNLWPLCTLLNSCDDIRDLLPVDPMALVYIAESPLMTYVTASQLILWPLCTLLKVL